MSFYELRYHARRMWGRFGLKEVIVNNSGVKLFKFKDEKGMSCLLGQGPWLIRSRPLFVQKWDPEIGMIKAEPKYGIGRTDYARVLVEIEAKKDLGNKIKIKYIGKNENVKGIKEIDICHHCSVFGHSMDKCTKRSRTEEETKAKIDAEQREKEKNMATQNEGFTEVQNKIPQNQNKNWQQRLHNGNRNRQEYRKRNVNNDGENRFGVLNEVNTSEETELSTLKYRILVDVYLNKKLHPTCAESSNWSKDMIKYFKDQWEIDMLKEHEDQSKNVEDVFENVDGIGQTMTDDNVTGFWVSNVSHSQNGCRILVSWDKNKVDVSVLFSSRQTMLCLIKTIPTKRITSGWPWLMTGDFNVTLKNEEHSNGGSRVTNNMQDFIDCVNEAEVEDLNRAMVNDDLMLQFYDANALYLSYLVSDHSPAVVRFPHSFRKKKKAFIFANFIAEKDEFIHTVAAGWEIDVQGHRMYKLVKKMKALKLEEKLMDGQFVNHFRNFLGANKVTNEVPNFEGVFGTKLNHEDAMEMIKGVTDSEIKNALFDIVDNKAPGPDGYTSTFFKKAWKIVGKDVCLAIKEFFTTGKLLREMNATIISFIPKIITPNKVSDYRPIACCNVIYKCIRRFIQDNILITQELLKGYDRKSGPSRCCMKIDIAKAYDIVDWKFLEMALN
ncbi:RNA-directed DNA polymerase, eukaryota, reverse transcriptase zinc-binding domain protein [Tanacetum coccineum]